MAQPQIDVIVYRDPDGDTELSVFLDGRRLSADDFTQHTIDPGAGWTRAEWNERIAETEAMPSSALRDELLAALGDSAGSEFITD